MSINLQKGQRVDLSKHDGSSLKKITVGLGWDVAEEPKKGFFASLSGGGKKVTDNFDCDAIAILCGADGKTNGSKDTVYFNCLEHPSGAVRHTGDNTTGEGEGDDEQIIVDLTKVPPNIEKIVFAVSIYKGREKGQHFGLIDNAFIRAVDDESGNEIFKYDLSENYSGKTGMVFGEMYRKDGKWKFNAIGEPVDDGSYVQNLVNLYL